MDARSARAKRRLTALLAQGACGLGIAIARTFHAIREPAQPDWVNVQHFAHFRTFRRAACASGKPLQFHHGIRVWFR